MNIRLSAVAQYSADRGFEDVPPDNIHRSKTRYMAAFNGPSSLLHTVEVLHDLGMSLRRARILPEIGRALEPETRLYPVNAYLDGISASATYHSPVRVSINVREDNRLHRFAPLLAVGLPSIEAVHAWSQGRAAPGSPWDEEQLPPLSPLAGYHRFYWEPGAITADWTNRITPTERLALQLCQRFAKLRDPHEPPIRLSQRMLHVVGSGLEERDNPLAGLIVDADTSLISQIGTIQELIEVFLTQAMLTIAGGDILGGFEYIIPFDPPEGRPIAIVLNQQKNALDVARWFRDRRARWPGRTYQRPDGEWYNRDGKRRHRAGEKPDGFDSVDDPDCEEDKKDPTVESAAAEVAKWFNAYPHRTVKSVAERFEPWRSLDGPSSPTRWSANDPGVRQATERIANWYRNGGVQQEPWERDGTQLRYKLPGEPLESDDMLSLARAYLPEFLPDYPRQVYVSGGMNVEGVLLGLITRWLEDGSFLGMDYSDWALFSLDQQAILCGLLVQRSRRTDQCAVFEAALRLLIDEGIKTWLELYRTQKIGLDRADRASPLAQLGFCMPLGGNASLHAPSLKVRIPLDYTDPETNAEVIDRKLRILENLFLPAHIPVQHIWDIDWVKLGETAYLKPLVNAPNPDLVPTGVRLYGGLA